MSNIDSTPLVSIIMGTYNSEKTIKKCIDSILKQTYSNWEFIICDDCSHDSTVELLEFYQNIDNRIHIIKNKENLKLAATLNKCLSYAKGKYIARMDSDDESMPNRLEIQVSFLEKNTDYMVVGCSAYIFDGNKIVSERHLSRLPKRDDCLKKVPFMHPTIMMRKVAYDNLNGYQVLKRTQRGQDVDLWIRYYSLGYKGYNLEDILYIYHESDSDLNKRTLKASISASKTVYFGCKLLRVPIYKYIYMIKPIISFLIPQYFKVKLRN